MYTDLLKDKWLLNMLELHANSSDRSREGVRVLCGVQNLYISPTAIVERIGCLQSAKLIPMEE